MKLRSLTLPIRNLVAISGFGVGPGPTGPSIDLPPTKFFTPKQFALRASRRAMAKASRKRNR